MHVQRIISPPLVDHMALRQPMTAGEKIVFDFFNRNLPKEWEIYIQPHLNGLCPDFVIINPNAGIGVFEVKDWNLRAMRYHVKYFENGYKELLATYNGKTFAIENPFNKIRKYKNEIFNVYCPRLQQKSGFGAINAGVIFPFANREEVLKLQEPFLKENELKRSDEFWPVIGRSEISNAEIGKAVPLLNREGRSYMHKELAEDLRGWLVEPDFSKMQRVPLETVLDKTQRNYAEDRTKNGYRRIRGPAGSGKSLVLAARAANLINSGKDVLIVTYNITLWHYLRDLVARGRKSGNKPGTLTFTHFHKWCGEVCWNSSFADAYTQIMKPITNIEKLFLPPHEKAKLLRPILPPILNYQVPELARKAANNLSEDEKYDAILVDEGQDYQPSWWNALRAARREDGEMLLVADTSQDVYGSAKSWTEEAMGGAGFVGPWAELNVSYRLPSKLLSLSHEFAEKFLPSSTRIISELDNVDNKFPCELEWIQCEASTAIEKCVDQILIMMKKTGLRSNLANADIIFLSTSNQTGRKVVERLSGEPWGIQVAHTFADNKAELDRRKMAFFLGRSQIKATTLHSFKGWETRALVLHIGHANSPESMAAVYAAITRLRGSTDSSFLTVICSAPELSEYGRSWIR